LMVFMGGSPFGSPLIGWLSTQIGVRETLTFCGAVTLFAALSVYGIASRARRRLR
jgi:predicted MFS family arabinose efflux permease